MLFNQPTMIASGVVGEMFLKLFSCSPNTAWCLADMEYSRWIINVFIHVLLSSIRVKIIYNIA